MNDVIEAGDIEIQRMTGLIGMRRGNGPWIFVWTLSDKNPNQELQRAWLWLEYRVPDPDAFIAEHLPELIHRATEAAFK